MSILELKDKVLKNTRKHFEKNAIEVMCSGLQDYRSYLPASYHLNQNAVPFLTKPDLSVKTDNSELYLAPFHEFELRAICSLYKKDVYQISPCFRNEQDETHLYCFNMIEWARIIPPDRSELAYLIDEPIELIVKLFDRYIGYPQSIEFNSEKFMNSTSQVPSTGYYINHKFPELQEYPSPKCTNGKQQRVEFFYNSIEIANIFLDNTNPEDFKSKWPQAPDSIIDLVRNAPATVCGAIGLERLLMAISGRKNIHDISPNILEGDTND